jgi:hypothetical protein
MMVFYIIDTPVFYYVNRLLYFIYLFSSLANQVSLFCKQIYSRKQDFHFLQLEFQELPRQVEIHKQVERSGKLYCFVIFL